MLSQDQIRRYHEEGYLVVRNVLATDDLAALRDATNELAERARGLEAHSDLHDLEDTHTPEHPRLRRLKSPDRHHSTFAGLVRHPVIVACLEALWGTGVRFDVGKLNMKGAGYGAPVEWHQD